MSDDKEWRALRILFAYGVFCFVVGSLWGWQLYIWWYQ